MLNKDKEKLVRKYIDAYNKKDIRAMLKCVSEDVVFKNIMNGITAMEIFGINSLQELASKTKDLFSEREQSITNISYDGEKMRVDIHFDAVFAMDLPNGITKGQKISVDGYSEFEFKGNFISSIADCS